MTAVLTFEPLPSLEPDSNGHDNRNSGFGSGSTALTFEPTDVELRLQDQIYLLGSLSRSSSDSDAALNRGAYNEPELEFTFDSDSGSGSEYTRDGQKNRSGSGSRTRAVIATEGGEDGKQVAPVEILGRKLTIVPAKSRPREMKDVYAAIWLAPGYKVMLLPARRHRVFYQRAVPGNRKWKEVDEGYSVDLADPLMTVLDNAIHIKVDVRPDKDKSLSSSSLGKDLPSRISKLINRVQQLQKYRLNSSSSTASSKEQSTSLFSGVGVRVHTEIEGTEEMHSSRGHRSYYEIAARVRVTWYYSEALEEMLRIPPERGNLYDLRAQREKVWKEMEKDPKSLDGDRKGSGSRLGLDHFVANTTNAGAGAEKDHGDSESGGKDSASHAGKQQRSKRRSRSPSSPSSSNRRDDSEPQLASGQKEEEEEEEEEDYLPPPPLSPGVAIPESNSFEYASAFVSADEIGVAISTPPASSAPSLARPKAERTPSNVAKSPASRESSRASRESRSRSQSQGQGQGQGQGQSQEAKSTRGHSRSRSPSPTPGTSSRSDRRVPKPKST